MWKMKTQRSRIPWSWLILLGMPAIMSAFIDKCSETALTFTMKKFTDDPVTISVLGSLNILFGLTIAPLVAYYSDKSKGSLGRRRPFMILGLLIAGLSLIIIPFTQSLLSLAIAIIIFFAAIDFGFTGLWDPLYADLVPDKQRGRGMVVNRYMAMAARLLFMFFLIGKFKEHVGQPKILQALTGSHMFNLTGEQLIYFIAAAMVIITALFIVFFIKETNNTLYETPDKFRIKEFFSDIFGSKQNRQLFLLMAASALMTVKLKNLMPLLFTEQFGFSMKTMGQVHGTTMAFNCFIVLPVAAILADRVNRYKLFLICLAGSTIQPIVFWSYVKWFAIPTQSVAIGFHVADAAFDHMALIALWPLLYESIVPQKRGSLKAGLLIIGGLVSFILSILLGIWIKWFTTKTTGGYDYMSGYLLIFISGIIACVLAYLAARKNHKNFD